jgi:hypothetical protein
MSMRGLVHAKISSWLFRMTKRLWCSPKHTTHWFEVSIWLNCRGQNTLTWDIWALFGITVILFCHVVMSTHFYSCRYLLSLQVQRFVEQQQVSLKWITQGLSNSGRLEVKAIPLKQPCNYDTESFLCPQHTQYTCQMYRCTSSVKR